MHSFGSPIQICNQKPNKVFHKDTLFGLYFYPIGGINFTVMVARNYFLMISPIEPCLTLGVTLPLMLRV